MSTRQQRRQASSSQRSLTSTTSPRQFATDNGLKECDPSDIAQKFRAVESVPDRFRDELPELDLPGLGTAYDDCGGPFFLACTNCGRTTSTPRTCYRTQCPDCGAWGVKRQATTAASKLEATRLVKEANEGVGWSGYKFHHLALSPPDGWAVDAEDPIQATIDIIKEVLEELGAVGGLIAYHPYRGAGEEDDEIADDRGFWSDILFNDDVDTMADIRDDLVHEPHFHAVIVSKFVAGQDLTAKIHHESGWVLKRITKGGDESDSNVSLYDEYDLCRAVSYCLSHTGLYETKNGMHSAYRYFGETANLQPREKTAKRIDAAMRSVVPRTLGLPYSDLACNDDPPAEDAADNQVVSPRQLFLAAIASSTEATDGDGDGDEPPADKVRDDDKESPSDRCAGRLTPITQAPALLEDDEWVATADHVDELRETWKEWQEIVEDYTPAAPPPPA